MVPALVMPVKMLVVLVVVVPMQVVLMSMVVMVVPSDNGSYRHLNTHPGATRP